MKLFRLFVIVLVFLFSVLIGCSENPIDYEVSLDKRDGIYFSKGTNIPYSGPVFSIYKDGTIKTEGHLTDGLKSKTWKYYRSDGQIMLEGENKENDPVGEWTFRDNDGDIFVGEIDPEKETTGSYLYTFRKYVYLYNTFEDGEPDGLFASWDKHGNKESQGNIINRKPEGVWLQTEIEIRDDYSILGYGLKVNTDSLLLIDDLSLLESIVRSLKFNKRKVHSIFDEYMLGCSGHSMDISSLFPYGQYEYLDDSNRSSVEREILNRQSIKDILVSKDHSYLNIFFSSSVISEKSLGKIVKKDLKRYGQDISVYIPSFIRLSGDLKDPSTLMDIIHIERFLYENYDLEYSFSVSDVLTDLYRCANNSSSTGSSIPLPSRKVEINNLWSLHSMSVRRQTNSVHLI